MDPGTLLIRADASVAIGTGHVMRCLALAQAWQDAGGRATFALAEAPAAIERRLITEGVAVAKMRSGIGSEAEASELANLAHALKASWIVFDGERFGATYIQSSKEKSGLKVLSLDDFGNVGAKDADLVLNQNPGVSRKAYAWCQDDARLLLGTDYVLLRREFRQLQTGRDLPTAARTVLVTFGGSDPDNLTEKVFSVLAANSEQSALPCVTAIVGGANPRAAALERLASSIGMTFLVDPPNVPHLMTKSDLAVIVAGGTLWELLHAGCAVLSYSRNSLQGGVIGQLARAGVVLDLGPVAAIQAATLVDAVRKVAGSKKLREWMRAAGQSMIDGNGALRVVQIMKEH